MTGTVKAASQQSLKVLLPTMGSAGDVHPFIALGVAMQARGPRATILTNPLFQPVVEAQGLGFLAVGTVEEANTAIANPETWWHLRKGFGVIAQVLVPAIERTYRLIEKHADSRTVVAFSSLAIGARLAQEKLGVPSASVHLQPSIIRTYADQGMMGNVRLSASTPLWFKQGLFRLIDAAVLDRRLARALEQPACGKLCLPPISRVMHRWLHSPQLVIAFFPEWFAAPQPDWPASTHAVGFRIVGRAWRCRDRLADAEAISVVAGPAPDSLHAGIRRRDHAAISSRNSVQAGWRWLGLRAMLAVTNYPDQGPLAAASPGVQVFGYVPFSQDLPRAALLVYHGGVGTLAQGIKASVPHLVVPHGYDQFDQAAGASNNLWLGRAAFPRRRYRARRVARAIEDILGDASAPAAPQAQYAERINSAGRRRGALAN